MSSTRFSKRLHRWALIGLSPEPIPLFSEHRLLSVVNKERLAVPLFSFCLDSPASSSRDISSCSTARSPSCFSAINRAA